MLLLLLLSLSLLASKDVNANLQIGVIRNAWWDQPAARIQSGITSCNECICIMLMSFSTVLGFNCFSTNQTCYLFTNYSVESSMRISNENDTFFFLMLPSKAISPASTTVADQLQITTESMSFTQIFWSFDNSTNDIYNIYNGIIINNASYSPLSITGYGSSLLVQFDLYQYVNVSSPAPSLSNSSFTFELWINANSLNLSYFYGLIGQCTSHSANMCFHTALRDRQPFFGFFENDCIGQTVLNTSTWYHIAFVYSYELSRQAIYLNGFLDGEKYAANPFQGSAETPLTIGTILPPERWPFDGKIDQISFINRAKNNIEILNDATLVVHYSFDSDLFDSGPMKINGTGVNISFINHAVEFTHNPSNIQVTGLTLLGTSNWPYSIALWIYPYSITGGSLVYLWLITMPSAWCLPLLGLSTSGSLIAQQYSGSSVVTISSGIILNATWTHIVYTYSINIGIQLYINGTLANTSMPFSYSSMSQPGSITLGLNSSISSQSGCDWQPNSIDKIQYYGLIDEFYLYSHQLTTTEIQRLATR